MVKVPTHAPEIHTATPIAYALTNADMVESSSISSTATNGALMTSITTITTATVTPPASRCRSNIQRLRSPNRRDTWRETGTDTKSHSHTANGPAHPSQHAQPTFHS